MFVLPPIEPNSRPSINLVQQESWHNLHSVPAHWVIDKGVKLSLGRLRPNYFSFTSIETTEPLNNRLATKIAPPSEIDFLKKLYSFSPDDGVSDYISNNRFLVPVLAEIYRKLDSYFTGFSPGIAFFHTEENEEPYLVMRVKTKMPPADAYAQLERFDEDWWLDHCLLAQNKLSITVQPTE